MHFDTKYDRQYADPGVSFVDAPSLTQQHFKDECDIKVILRRLENGENVEARQLQFGDFSSRAASDYQTALNRVLRARDQFDALPSAIRKRFNHDPKEFLKFVGDAANYDEGVKLGIFAPKAEVATSAVVAEPASGGSGSDVAT